MSTQSEQAAPVSPGDRRVIRSNADEILALPDGEFTRPDVDALLKPTFECLRQTGALVSSAADDGSTRWRVDPAVREECAAIVEARDAVCPCGHAGVRNAGDRYYCAAAHCEQWFTRAELDDDATAASREGGDPYWTTIQYWRTDGRWRATEPAGDNQLVGQGATPREATLSYICQLRERDHHGE